MEEFVLKGKSHQIFLAVTSPAILATFIPNNDSDIQLIKILFMTLPFILWVFMLGKALNQCIPRRYQLSEGFLIFNLFFFILVYVAIVMLLDLTVYFNGIAVFIPLYLIFSFLYLFYFASKALTSAESGKRTSFSEHFKEFLFLLFGIIGIWNLQPRINQLWESNKNKFSEAQELED